MTVNDMPKIVLHLHLDGSIDLDDAYKWAKEDGIKCSKKEILNLLQVGEEVNNLNDYLKKFSLPCKLLQTCERLEIATYHLYLKLASFNVVYAEVRFAPNKHREKKLSLDDIVMSVINGMNKAYAETGIMGGIILSLMRGDDYQDNLQIIDLAKKYLNKGVCAIDLAGAEAIYPTHDYTNLFSYAKSINVPFTIHAGEAAGIESIMTAINMGAKRIGHGIRAVEDKALQQLLIHNDILLEVCVTSNYQTGAVKGKHPIKELYKTGVKVSINTDNDTVSNTDINKEYNIILQNTDMTIKDLENCNINSISFIFANDTIKKKLQKIFKLED